MRLLVHRLAGAA